jgi:hypothetical protein
MRTTVSIPCSRRRFLGSAVGLGLGWASSRLRAREDRPAASAPLAISGDPIEPAWHERLTLTVGPRNGDLVGADDKVIQAAADYVARLGGGTVRLLPGTYRMRNSVFLPSRVRLLGCGADSLLIKQPSLSTRLAADSDWYDQEITLADPRGFRVGDGVCLRARNTSNQGHVVLKRTLVARSGSRFKLDRPLRENLWLAGEPTVAALFPLLSGENIADVVIEDLTLDGNKANNENLDGNYSGCVFLQDCNRIALRRVTARENNGDGISWQICHDVVVEDCRSHDHAGLGLHPGSGSQRTVIRNNTLERNQIGLFFCWGVKDGLAEQNTIRDSRDYGISIGHRDTNNVIRDNQVVQSGKVGVLFRGESRAFGPHRNRLENNRIVDSGSADGVGVDVRGETEAVTVARNEVRETRRPMDRIGVRIGAKTREVLLVENRIEGFSVAVVDQGKP